MWFMWSESISILHFVDVKAPRENYLQMKPS